MGVDPEETWQHMTSGLDYIDLNLVQPDEVIDFMAGIEGIGGFDFA